LHFGGLITAIFITMPPQLVRNIRQHSPDRCALSFGGQTMNTPYELLGGDEGVKRLAYEFYKAMDDLSDAETIRKMHAESLEDVSEKLYQYLSGWLGGPGLYQQKFGTVCLTKPHKPYAIGEAERDQWLLCMDTALERVGASDEVKSMLKEPIRRLADFMRTQ
jgi:hemoglobin